MHEERVQQGILSVYAPPRVRLVSPHRVRRVRTHQDANSSLTRWRAIIGGSGSDHECCSGWRRRGECARMHTVRTVSERMRQEQLHTYKCFCVYACLVERIKYSAGRQDALLHELEHAFNQSGIGHTKALERPSQSGALL